MNAYWAAFGPSAAIVAATVVGLLIGYALRWLRW